MRVRSAPLVVRGPALAALRALPEEWEEWAEEPAHQVVVVEAGDERPIPESQKDGEVVGALHVAMVSAREAWLEGVRVRRDRQGRGVARRLVQEGEALAKRYGAGIVRTGIPSHEYAAQAVAERAGYRPVTRAVVFELSVPDAPIDVPYDAAIRDAQQADLAPLMTWIKSTETVQSWHGLVPLGWRFRTLVPELVKGWIKDGRVLVSGERAQRGLKARIEGGALFALHASAAVVYAVDGPPSHVQGLLGAVAERAAARGVHRIVVFAPHEGILDAVRWPRRAHAWGPDGLAIVEKAI